MQAVSGQQVLQNLLLLVFKNAIHMLIRQHKLGTGAVNIPVKLVQVNVVHS